MIHRAASQAKPAAGALVSTADAAEIASCHRLTIVRAIERGELAAVRLGRTGHYRIERESLTAWLEPVAPMQEGSR